MASASGNFSGSYSGISIVLATSEASTNSADNTSAINWSVYLYYGSGLKPYDFSGSSYWTGSIGGISFGTKYYNYDFRGATAGQTYALDSGQIIFPHASDGTGSVDLSISTVAASPLGSSTTGTGTQATTDFSRKPQAPAAPSISRPNTGTTITVTSAIAAEATGSSPITGATANGSQIVYSVYNNAAVGGRITVTGITPSSFNITAATITARTTYTITVASSLSSSTTYTSGGTVNVLPPPITDYKYRYNTTGTGSWTEVTGMGTGRTQNFGPTSPITVSGTQVYYFQTAAANSEEFGAWSGNGIAYAAPSITSVTKNGTSATVTVAPASSNGGSAVTSHTVQYSTDQSTWVGGQSISGASGGSTTFTGLPAGKTYYFRAYAINAIPVISPYQYNLSTGGTASIFISAYGKRYQTKTVSGVTAVGNTTTYTCTAHGFSVGDPVAVTGITPSTLNASGTVTAITTDSFTLGTTTPATTSGTYGSGGTAGGWATILTGKRYAADDGTGNPGWVNITSSQKYTAGAWTSFN
jgi:hypothetical protein